jgi:hypothetical protein
MKKKVFALLMSTIMLLSLLTGCIHQDMGVKMNKDGTGSITTTLGIEKDFYEQLKSMGSDPFEGKTVAEYQYDGSTYVSYAETKEYSSYEDMEKALLEMTYETEIIEEAQNAENEDVEEDAENPDDIFDVTIEEPETVRVEAVAPTTPAQDNHIFSSVNIEKNGGIFYSSYTFAAVLNPQNGDGLDYDLNETFKVTLTVEMPTEITGAKGGTVEGNKVVFDIADITATQELAATCEENNTGLVIGIVIGLVVLVAGAVCLIKFKK